jgi:hypothetical protein
LSDDLILHIEEIAHIGLSGRSERSSYPTVQVSRDRQQEKQDVLARFIKGKGVTEVQQQKNEKQHDPDTAYRYQHPRQINPD